MRETSMRSEAARARAPAAWAARAPDYDLAAWRRRIPLLETTIALANCSQGPASDATVAAVERFLASWTSRGMDWEAWIAEVEAARAAFASLVGAASDEIAVTSSVSSATSSLASALDFGGSRNAVVLSDAEFPAVAHVWLAQEKRGARLCRVPLRHGGTTLEDYAAAIDERTLVVSACHAFYQNGFRQDVRAIADLAHRHGALLFVDAYQTAGLEPVDVTALGADALASGCLKFLMGTAGLAFLYVRRDLADRLTPAVTGWLARRDPFAFDPRTLDWTVGTRRFDTGTPPIVNAYACRAGLDLIAELGVERVASWTRTLSERLLEGAAARGLPLHGTTDPGRKTSTTAILCDDAHAVERTLRDRGVLAAARGPALRLAPHFFTTTDDVDRALDHLADALAARRRDRVEA